MFMLIHYNTIEYIRYTLYHIDNTMKSIPYHTDRVISLSLYWYYYTVYNRYIVYDTLNTDNNTVYHIISIVYSIVYYSLYIGYIMRSIIYYSSI